MSFNLLWTSFFTRGKGKPINLCNPLYLCLLPLPSGEYLRLRPGESLGLGWALGLYWFCHVRVEMPCMVFVLVRATCTGFLPFWTMRWLLWFSGHVQSCWQVVCSCTWVIKSSIIRRACVQGHLQPEVFLRSQQSRWFYRMLFGLQHTFLVQEFISMYKGLVEHLSRAQHCSRWRYIRQIKALLAQSLCSSGEGEKQKHNFGLKRETWWPMECMCGWTTLTLFLSVPS